MKRPMFIFLLVLTGILPVRSQTVFFNHGQYGSFSIMTNNALSLLSPQGGAGFMTRQQWVGLDGAPRSFVGTGHVGFPQYGVTTGLSVRQDRVGVGIRPTNYIFPD